MIKDEIERRFLCLCTNVLDLALAAEYGKMLEQLYLSFENDTVMRIRSEDDKKFILCEKKGRGIRRTEDETEIDSTTGRIMIVDARKSEKPRIKKLRWILDRWEVDWFLSPAPPNDYWRIAEIELKSENEPFECKIPGLKFIREITNDDRYTNYQLATNGWPKEE